MKRLVKRVIDGDTFEMNETIQNMGFIRLARVNAPEKETASGKEATKILNNLIKGKFVDIIPKARSYNRLVAEVYRLGKNINDQMIKRGY